MGQEQMLLRQLDKLRLQDQALARRLKQRVALTVANHDLPDDGETIPVDAAANLALDIYVALADVGDTLAEAAAKEEELLRLVMQLRERRDSPRNLERAGGRMLVRQVLKGKDGDGA